MGIARLTRCHRETLFPRRKKVHLQKMIRGREVVDPGQAHFLYQAVLQRFEQSFDPPFGLRTVRRDPFDPQLAERSSEMRTGFLSPQLFSQRPRSRRPEDAIFIGVMRQRTSVAPQPFPESPQVLFRSVVFCKTRIETAGGVVDHRNQLASRPALLQPTKRGAILHDQLAKTGAALPPHMDGLYALCARAPQAGLHHPLAQRLAAHPHPPLGQVLGGQRRPKVRVALAHPRQNLLLETYDVSPVRWPSAYSMDHRAVTARLQSHQQPSNLSIADL